MCFSRAMAPAAGGGPAVSKRWSLMALLPGAFAGCGGVDSPFGAGGDVPWDADVDAAGSETGAISDSGADVPDTSVDGPVVCGSASECPEPTPLCQVAICASSFCGMAPAPEGTDVPVSAQTPGDCKQIVCGAGGGVTSSVDATDVPRDDGNPCTTEVCVGPNPAHPRAPVGSSCKSSGGTDAGASQGYCNSGGGCGDCLPGSSDCDGSTPRTCNSTGAWVPGVACPFVCSGAGRCSGACKPGEVDCQGAQPRMCFPSGTWGLQGSACPYVCESGSCKGVCAPGQVRCDGATPQACDSSGIWTGGNACPFVCTGAAQCTGICVPGATDCAGKQPRICDATGHWGANGAACPNVCSGGQCAGNCPPGAAQCSAAIPQSCDATGAWVDGPACPFVCAGGSCTGVCAVGETRCAGSAVQSCTAGGQWTTTSTCPYVCSSSACTGLCIPAATRCLGNTQQTCDATGQWQSSTACGFVCAAGACTGVCSPGATQCSGKSLQTCSALGQWQTSTTCPFLCEAAACSGTCSPGALQCSGLTTQSCSATGSWSDGASCPFACTAGTCVGLCTPGNQRCSGTEAQACSALGQWQTTQVCGGLCVSGSCLGVCTPASKQCSGAIAQTCDTSGQWQTTATCSGNTPTCSGGSCVAAGVSVSSGYAHTCAVIATGAVECVGGNTYGQLGNGTTAASLVPVVVSGLSVGARTIAAGYNHSCAINASGSVSCWGLNTSGQIGNGTVTNSATPVPVSGLPTTAIGIGAGNAHSCALTTAGAVYCWGANTYGQLGNGTTTNSPTAVAVTALGSGVTALSVGYYHTCVITSAGGAQCWGYNPYGGLGNGTSTNSSVPVSVSGLTSGVTSIGAGLYSTCAVTVGGAAACWGYNVYGGLGNGTTTTSLTPAAVTGLASGAASVTVGQYTSCARTTGGAAFCWGYDVYGQLGNGVTGTSALTAVAVSGLGTGVVGLGVSVASTFCAVVTGGGVRCWGFNTSGQLGNNSTANSAVPVTAAF